MPQIHSDDDLLRLLKQGDDFAFRVLYDRYWQQLFFMAHKRLNAVEDAQEIVQNIFFTLWQKRASLEINCLPVYLAGMLRYAVFRQLANRKRRAVLMQQYRVIQGGRSIEALDLDNKQLLEILNRFTQTLPEKFRLVFIQHKLLDRSLEEVAAEMGVSPRTAEGYVARVMKIMRKHRHDLAFKSLLL